MTDALVTGTARPRLEYLPVGLFGSVMGLTGLSVAWKLAEARYGIPAAPSQVLAAFAVVDFVALGFAYLTKLVTAPEAVLAEWKHPIAGSMAPCIVVGEQAAAFILKAAGGPNPG